MIGIDIEFTGTTLLYFKRGVSPRYYGKAYLVGKGHQPRLVVPIRNIKNLTADVPPHMRAVYPPGGPMLAEVDLTGRTVTFDDNGGTPGVELTKLSAQPHDQASGDLGLIVDVGYLGGTVQKPAQIADDADGVAAALVVLDRGSLSAIEPKDAPLLGTTWELTAPDGGTKTQMLSGAAMLRIDHGENEFEIHLHDWFGRKAGRLLIQKRSQSEKRVPLSIFSMCEVRGTPPTYLSDVAHYSDLLKGRPLVQPPKYSPPPAGLLDGYVDASGDTGQCPPGMLVS